MHEMSLCEGILQVLEEQATSQQFERVKAVRLEIGRFSTVEEAALRFSFDVVMRGSLADSARLDIIHIPGQAFCFGCGQTVEIDDRLSDCPSCGGSRLVPSGGMEMRIKDLEVL